MYDGAAAIFRELPEQEEIALVAVRARRPLLAQAHAIHVGIDLRTGNAGTTAFFPVIADFAELDVNPLVAQEGFLQVADIFCLALLAVLHSLRHEVVVRTGPGRNDLARDDERVFAEYLVNEVDILLVVGRAETFDILHDDELLFLLHHASAVFQAFGQLSVQSQTEVGQSALSVELHYRFLVRSHAEVLSFRRNNQRDVTHHHRAVFEDPAPLHHFVVVAIERCNGPQAHQRAQREVVHRQVFGRQDFLRLLGAVDFGQHQAQVALRSLQAGRAVYTFIDSKGDFHRLHISRSPYQQQGHGEHCTYQYFLHKHVQL